VRRAAIVLGTAGLALAGASPAAAAEVTVAASDQLVWDKPEVKVAIGDTVKWTFAGTTLPHNVQSASANWTMASTIGAPAPDKQSDPFTATGRYDFVCQLHQDTMRGTVIVGAPPPPPLSEQPFVNDSGAPGVFETGEYDDVEPRLSGLGVRRAGGGARIAFTVSERARVTARFLRGGKVRRTARVTAEGDGVITVRKGLKTGRYRIGLRAEDLAGNRSAKRTLRLTVR
jgi:plastocyanin